MRTETKRKDPAGMPVSWTIDDKKSVKNEKLATKPRTTPIGRDIFVFLSPIEEDSTIGNMGKMQGDNIVTIPARNAKGSNKIIRFN
jgi:hypothetical protein